MVFRKVVSPRVEQKINFIADFIVLRLVGDVGHTSGERQLMPHGHLCSSCGPQRMQWCVVSGNGQARVRYCSRQVSNSAHGLYSVACMTTLQQSLCNMGRRQCLRLPPTSQFSLNHW